MDAEQILKFELRLRSLDPKICLKEVNSFKCCIGIKQDLPSCEHFLDLAKLCYTNKGRLRT